jgi:hypothetical protein
LRTVATILANPRYTGRQVWNRQRTDHDPADPAGGRYGPRQVRRWNPAHEWVISTTVVHPALVSEDDFVAAQAITAIPTPAEGATHTYTLVGLLRCHTCGRRMESHWVHHRPGYRCRHGHSSALPATPGRPKTLYLREDHILARIATQLDHVQAHDQTVPGDPRKLADHLRVHGMTILCDATTCILDTGRPATDRTRAARLINQAAQHGPARRERPPSVGVNVSETCTLTTRLKLPC